MSAAQNTPNWAGSEGRSSVSGNVVRNLSMTVILEVQTPPAQVLAEEAVLFPVIGDHVKLAAICPARPGRRARSAI
jgi:hypothetical protein